MKFNPPQEVHLDAILPDEPLLLMGAGPVPIPHAVARANTVVINHVGETMNRVIAGLKRMSKYVFQTESDKIIGVAGSASAAMEMAVTNLLWPGRSALVLANGTFSARFGEMAQAVGADTRILRNKEVTSLIPMEEIEAAFAQKHYDVLTIAQGETSCGVHNHHLREVAKLAKKHGALVIVDAVCTLSAMPLSMDEWGLDVVVTGGQKGLSSIPGVSLLAFSEAAWTQIESRQTPCPHWVLDALKAQRFWGEKQYHYTAPVSGILALYEALRLICQETLEARFQRHTLSSKALQAGIEAMGLSLFVPEKNRLNSVVAINSPRPGKIDLADVRDKMVKRFKVEIAGAFGLDILRIGQMGEQCRASNLFKTLYALGMSFNMCGLDLDLGAGMASLENNLAIDLENYVD